MSIISEAPASPSTVSADETRTPRWSDARDQMIHACALAEHIISMATVLPTSVTVNMRYALARGYRYTDGETDVVVHLHADPDAVRAYQEFLGGTVVEAPHGFSAAGVAQVKVELTGELFGCSFSVWALVDVPAVSA